MTYTKTILNGVKVWVEGKLNKLETLIEDIKIWANGTFVSYKPQTLTDTEKQQAQENIGIVITPDEEAIELLVKNGIIDLVADVDGAILTDENNNIIAI